MTDGLSAAELAQIRADIEQLFPDTCSILTLTYTSDGGGGMTETWGTATGGTAIPCRVDYKSGRETMTGGAILPYQKAIVSMAYDGTITTAQRVQVGDDVFNVQAVNAGQSWIGTKRLTVELVP